MSGTYERLREIGRGGMATVYLARQTDLDRLVAIKVLNRETLLDGEYVSRFTREARIMAKMNHPHIVAVIESHFSDSECYIVTEYVDGGDFRRLLAPGPLPLPRKLRILLTVSDALQYAHAMGVVHRDVKPSNILLTSTMEPKLADFGIATALWGQNTQLTATRQAIGTMDYIAPEQGENARHVDARADLYSLGVIFYILVTGRKPVGAFPPPADLVSSLPKRLNALIMKCLQPHPQDRFKSAANLSSELRQILDDWNATDVLSSPPRPESVCEQPTRVSGTSVEERLTRLRNASLAERTQLKANLLDAAAPGDVPRLLQALDTEQGYLRETVVEILGRLKCKEACISLIRLLGDPAICKTVAAALGEINCRDAEEPLLRLLLSESEAAWAALLPLGRLGSKRALKGMVRFLRSGHKWVREQAVEAIGAIGNADAREFLETAAERDPDSGVRARAKNILWRLKNERQQR
jgi:tRNA A-37 threonylcarbamoyl transferase component Bud32